jgi:hypothetical protein
MSNGLLAQWNRRIAGRGLVGAALLAVPVAVAAALSFSGGFSGLPGGLSALASGPDTGASASPGAQSLNSVLVAFSGTPGPATGGGTSGAGSPGGDGGAGEVGGNGGSSGGGTGGTGDIGGGAGGTIPNPPAVNLPADDPGGVGSLVDGVQGSVTDLVGSGQ